MTAQTLMDEPE